jgi:hypothetical protein
MPLTSNSSADASILPICAYSALAPALRPEVHADSNVDAEPIPIAS